MKKFLLILILLLFTSTQCFATVELRYNNAGMRSSVAYGVGAHRSINNFGSNALYTPENRIRAGQINRQIQRQKAITRSMTAQLQSSPYQTRALQTSIVSTPVSRYSKDFKISTTQKTYSRGGVTYYN